MGSGNRRFCGRNSVVECLLPKQKVNAIPGNPLFWRPCPSALSPTADFLRLTAQVAKLEVDLSNGNGGLTFPVKSQRVKFAGSLSLPWLFGILGGGSGAGWGLGRLLGAW